MNRVKVFSLQERKGDKSPWRVKWTVEGHSKTRVHRTKASAELYRAKLIAAASAQEPFSPSTGEPLSWTRVEHTYASVAREYASRKWAHWSASSRRSYVDAAAVTVALIVHSGTRKKPPRRTLSTALRNHYLPPAQARIGQPTEAEAEALAWLERASRRIQDVSVDVADAAMTKASRKLNGDPAKRTTINRRRAVMHSIFEHAKRQKYIQSNPLDESDWKSKSAIATVDKRAVLSPSQCRQAQAHLRALGPTGEVIATFAGVLWLAGLRPSEATGLRVSDLDLPASGWGLIQLSRALVETGARWTDSGTRNESRGLKWRDEGTIREVPIPPELVKQLRQHIAKRNLTGDALLFYGPTGTPLSLSTMDDYWRRARAALFAPSDPLRQSTLAHLRHTNASILLEAGLSVAETAQRLGHSPDVCLRIYAGYMKGLETKANTKIDDFLDNR